MRLAHRNKLAMLDVDCAVFLSMCSSVETFCLQCLHDSRVVYKYFFSNAYCVASVFIFFPASSVELSTKTAVTYLRPDDGAC